MLIRIEGFRGEYPRTPARRLPVGMAQAAHDVILETGEARPLRAPEIEHTFESAVLSFMRHNSVWFGWNVSGVRAVPGPVAQDRLYVTGYGVPKMQYDGVVYNLALAAPVDAPDVEITNLPAEPEPDDPDDPVTEPTSGGTTPAALMILRQPVGSRSGYVLQTQPAIAVVDEDGLLCDGDSETLVAVSLSSGVLGALSGTRAMQAVDGIIRFDDIVLTGDHEIDYRMIFEADGLEPAESGTITVTRNMASLTESIVYAYTFVTSLGEESAPSPLSAILDWYPGLSVEVSGFSTPPSSRLVTGRRIYRSTTSAAGVTDLYFVKEIPLATTVYDHVLEDDPIVEVIPSADFDTPPADMAGIVSMPNGFMAAYSGREVLFSEPYKPHAWPSKYRLTTESTVMGLGVIASSLVVATTGHPYTISGSTPDTMVMERIDISYPCLSSRGVVDLGYAIAYPSTDGLVVISGAGASLITREMITGAQWRALNPSSFIATSFAGLYVASRLTGVGDDREMIIIDLTQQPPHISHAALNANSVYADPSDGHLYLVDGETPNLVKKWDEGLPAQMRWKSGIIRTGAMTNFGALLIVADRMLDTWANATVYADGVRVGTITAKNSPSRIPGGFLATEWEIEITGTATISSVLMASTVEELIDG